jgi:hypothetical protein
MKIKNLRGKLVNVNPQKYLINWDGRNVSGPQQKFKNFIRPFWKNHIVLEEFRIPNCLLRIDIISLSQKIVCEISPESTHAKFNKFMHGSRAGYLKRIKADLDKQEWAESNGFKFIEVVDEDLLDENLNKAYYEDKFGIIL